MANLNDACVCPVCLAALQDPVILNCAHNLCFECAYEIIEVNCLQEKESKIFICPVCRKCTFLKSFSSNCLPRNQIVQAILHSSESLQNSTTNKCQACGNSEIYCNMCNNCKVMLCSGCAEAHISDEMYSDHIIRSNANEDSRTCIEHNLDEDLFCMDDKISCCTVCAQNPSVHAGHSIYTKELARTKLAAAAIETKKLIPLLEKRVESAKRSVLVELNQAESNDESDGILSPQKESGQDEISDWKKNSKIMKSYLETNLNLIEQVEKLIPNLYRFNDNLDLISQAHKISKLSAQFYKNFPQDVLFHMPKGPTLNGVYDSLSFLELNSPKTIESSQLFYLIRGSRDYFVYDFRKNEFQKKMIQDTTLEVPRWSCFVQLPNDYVLIMGGKARKNSGAKQTAFFLDPATGSTYAAPSMINGHSSHVSLLVDGIVYVISGKNENNLTATQCEALNLSTMTWNSIQNINLGRTCPGGASVGKKIYIFGGYQQTVNNTVEMYDISQDTWTLLAVLLPERLWQHGCYGISNNKILIFGGEGPSDEPHRVSYLYDINSEEFHSCTPIITTSSWLFFWLHIIRRGHLLFSINKEKCVISYNIASNEWNTYKI
ncbi:unnamed protein product [Blepharisma stoltei]|uniref:RING-type domain-containing protein n=1 Tax=Blepharisma stoltei TaxID=1481888 RepID=A0AAU9IUU3_9CILI|nr:unnamed protein product [Blepharisma stoltei]